MLGLGDNTDVQYSLWNHKKEKVSLNQAKWAPSMNLKWNNTRVEKCGGLYFVCHIPLCTVQY